MRTVLLVALAVLALAACGEREQTASGIKTDTPAYQGTNHAVFTAPGWKPGPKKLLKSTFSNPPGPAARAVHSEAPALGPGPAPAPDKPAAP